MLTVTVGYYLPELILLVLQHTLNMRFLEVYRDSPLRCNFNEAKNVQEIQSRVKEMTKNMLLDKAGLRSIHLFTHPLLVPGCCGRAPAGARAGFVYRFFQFQKLVPVLPPVSFPSLASRTKESVSVRVSSLSEMPALRFLPVLPFPLLLPAHGQSARRGLHIVLPARAPGGASARPGSHPSHMHGNSSLELPQAAACFAFYLLTFEFIPTLEIRST